MILLQHLLSRSPQSTLQQLPVKRNIPSPAGPPPKIAKTDISLVVPHPVFSTATSVQNASNLSQIEQTFVPTHAQPVMAPAPLAPALSVLSPPQFICWTGTIAKASVPMCRASAICVVSVSR